MRNRFGFTCCSCFALLALSGCGGGGSGNGNGQLSGSQEMQIQQLCVGLCTKVLDCEDAGSEASLCSSECSTSASSSTAIPSGCNVSGYLNAANACLQQSCTESSATLPPYLTCIEQAASSSGCESVTTMSTVSTSTGSGNATGTGTGNSTGTGTGSTTSTSTSSASCSICDKAATCCAAIETSAGEADAGDCTVFSTATCNSLGSSSGEFATECQDELSVGQAVGVAACN